MHGIARWWLLDCLASCGDWGLGLDTTNISKWYFISAIHMLIYYSAYYAHSNILWLLIYNTINVIICNFKLNFLLWYKYRFDIICLCKNLLAKKMLPTFTCLKPSEIFSNSGIVFLLPICSCWNYNYHFLSLFLFA